jgi:lipoate-protein ligase A
MQFEDYNLPDFDIFYSNKKFDFCIWQPDNVYVVLGRSNAIETSVNQDNVLKDGVKVMKRYSGGESVILTPKMLVVAVKMPEFEINQPKEYFKKINNIIIQVLQGLKIEDIGMKGISDLTLGDKKILGSSIYRKKDIVFYHCVLNVCENVNLISRYLLHPKKEPEYRKGRSHNEFVTSIYEQGYQIDIELLKDELNKSFYMLQIGF